jgi:hypothetical protein
MRKIGIITITLLMISSGLAFNTSILQYSSTQTEMVPGKTGIITLDISNLGTGTAEDVKVVLKSLENPLTSSLECDDCKQYSTAQQICMEYEANCYLSIGDLASGNSKQISFSINVPENIETGNYIASFDIHYKERDSESGVMETRRENIVSAITVDSITIRPKVNIKSINTPETVNPGEEFNITLELINEGLVKAKSITIELLTNDLKTKGTTNILSIGDLEAGEETEIGYALITDSSASSGVEDLIFNVSYSDELRIYSKTSSTGLVIGGDSDFNVFVQDITPESITRNSEVSAFISIANIGVTNARSVSIELRPSEDIELGNNNQDFLGDLDAGDFTTTSFDFKPLKEGQINLPLTIKYTTINGKKNEFNTTETVTIRFGEAAQQATGFNLTGVLIVGIFTIIGYFLIKKYAIKKK